MIKETFETGTERKDFLMIDTLVIYIFFVCLKLI